MRCLICAWIACAAATVSFGSEVQAAPPAPSEFGRYLELVWPGLQESPELTRIRESRSSIRFNDRALVTEAPLTVNSNLNRAESKALAPTPGSLRSSSDNFSNTLAYLNRFGVDATVTTTSTYTDSTNVQANPGDPQALSDQRSKQNQVSVTVGYDLIKGGDRGLGKTQERLTVIQNQQRSVILDQNEQAFYLGAFNDFVDYYAGLCLLQELKASARLTLSILSILGVKVDAKIVPRKDFLNFQSSESSSNLRVALQQATNATKLATFGRYGAEAMKASAALATHELSCAVDVDASMQRAKDVRINVEKTAYAVPAVKGADLAREAAALQLRVIDLTSLYTLRPFVSGSYGQAPDVRPVDTGSATLGATFNWILPVDNGRLLKLAASRDLAAANAALNDLLLQTRANLLSLQMQIATQSQVADSARLALGNSDELLKALRAQLAAGVTDSISYTTAQVDRLTSQQSLLDAWATLKKAAFEVEYDASFVGGGRRPTPRLD